MTVPNNPQPPAPAPETPDDDDNPIKVLRSIEQLLIKLTTPQETPPDDTKDTPPADTPPRRGKHEWLFGKPKSGS